MSLSDFITVIAIVLAPLLAFLYQSKLDDRKLINQRQLAIFRTLMTTRGAVLSFHHVEALNSIDVEFHGQERVVEAWRRYYNHLNQNASQNESVYAAWEEKQKELLTDLLYEMAVTLKYDFDKSVIERASYSPMAHGYAEQESQTIRNSLAQLLPALLKKEYAVPVDVSSKPENKEKDNQ
jgi:hypothetical protein